MFTKLMILAIPSVRMTIYRELRDLGQNNHHSERLPTKLNIEEFKMAGDYLKRIERVRIKMDFMKKLRVRGAATFQIRTPHV